jgi:hypothetical protein
MRWIVSETVYRENKIHDAAFPTQRFATVHPLLTPSHCLVKCHQIGEPDQAEDNQPLS